MDEDDGRGRLYPAVLEFLTHPTKRVTRNPQRALALFIILRVQFLNTFRAYAVAESGIRMFVDIGFDLILSFS